MIKTITTQSMWQQFITCRKSYEWRYKYGLAPKDKAEALSFGSLIHECLENWHYDPQPAKIQSIIDGAYPDRDTDENSKKNWHYARAMMKEYIRCYPEEEFRVIDLERQFEGPIVNPNSGYRSHSFTLAGKVDGIVDMDGEYYVLEHKTTAAINGAYLDRLWVDFQIIVYTAYMERVFKKKIAGVIYNILTKPKLRQGQGETDEEFQKRKAELLEKSKTGKTSAKQRMPESDTDFQKRIAEKYESDSTAFHREIIPISPATMDAVMEELWGLSQSLLEAQRRNNFYPNRNACFRFNRPCDYLELCRSNGNPNIIENYFEKRIVNEELAA